MAHMNSRRDEHYDKVVIDPAELESAGATTPRVTSGELVVSLARGTREQVVARAPGGEITERQAVARAPAAEITERQLPRIPEWRGREGQDDRRESPAPEQRGRDGQDDRRESPAPEQRGREDQDDRRERPAPAQRSRESQDDRRERPTLEQRALERDPIAVLRAWPHSTGSTAAPPPPPRALTAPQSPSGRRIQDKIVLAHLALDLFQEIDQLQAIVQRAHDGSSCDSDSATCSDPKCAATVDVLRGALVEACLLVQRVAMMPQDERLDIEDRIHELLELLHHTRGE
jgi:hypothetical protein